jgi:hypothetical protein
MANRSQRALVALSTDRALAICQALLPIAETILENGRQLKEVGFHAFEPVEAFIESFAETVEDVELHRRIQIELAKRLLGTPWPPLPASRGLNFKSGLLADLEAQRDFANGLPVPELERRYSREEAYWRMHVDPCLRNMARFEVTNRPLYRERWNEVVSAMKRLFHRESARFSSALSQSASFDPDGRYALFKGVMHRDASASGFQFDTGRSRSRFPVFSKPVSEEWDLCWAIEEPNFFLWNPTEGHFEPHLELRVRGLNGRAAGATPGTLMQIRYVLATPSFFTAYRTFQRPEELETLIKAHLFLFSLVGPKLEAGLEAILAKKQ